MGLGFRVSGFDERGLSKILRSTKAVAKLSGREPQSRRSDKSFFACARVEF